MSEPPTDSIPKMLGWDDLMDGNPGVDWLVDGILPSKSRAMLYADSGVGKSFTLLDMALHIATGRPWQGHVVKQGRVYYIAAENPETFYGRAQAWGVYHKVKKGAGVPIYLYPQAVDLTSATSVDTLLSGLQEARLVIVDTLFTSMGDGDIKEARDDYRVIAQINRVIHHTGATVLLAHHTPDSGKNPYGGSAWRGGLQVRMRLTRQRQGKNQGESVSFQDGDTITLAHEKLTQSALPKPIHIPIQLVPIKGCDTPMPVLASQRAKPRRGKSGIPFDQAYAQVGDNREQLAQLTGMSASALRQAISRLRRAESAHSHAA